MLISPASPTQVLPASSPFSCLQVPWDRVDTVLMHLTTTSHHRVWSFLQGRLRDGSAVITMQFPVPHVSRGIRSSLPAPLRLA